MSPTKSQLSVHASLCQSWIACEQVVSSVWAVCAGLQLRDNVPLASALEGTHPPSTQPPKRFLLLLLTRSISPSSPGPVSRSPSPKLLVVCGSTNFLLTQSFFCNSWNVTYNCLFLSFKKHSPLLETLFVPSIYPKAKERDTSAFNSPFWRFLIDCISIRLIFSKT